MVCNNKIFQLFWGGFEYLKLFLAILSFATNSYCFYMDVFVGLIPIILSLVGENVKSLLLLSPGTNYET